jgi:hypothetical protein
LGKEDGNAFRAVTPPSGNISSGLHKRQGKILTFTARQKVINVMWSGTSSRVMNFIGRNKRDFIISQ